MNNQDSWKTLLLSVQKALLGAITPQVRGVSCMIDESHIHIRVVFDGIIDECDEESMNEVETEVMADFPNNIVHLECMQVNTPQSLNPYMLKWWVYYRKESS